VLNITLPYLIGSDISCDLGSDTYKLNFKNNTYNYNNCILNLVGRSISKFFRNRRFKISLFAALVVMAAVTSDFVFNLWDLEIVPLRPLTCTEHSIGSVRIFLCWTWMRFPRVLFCR
jgi:hypothetical protein